MSAFRRDNTDEYESRLDGPRQMSQAEIRVTDRRGGNRQSPHHEAVGEMLAQKDATAEKEKSLEELVNECFMNPGQGRVVVMPDVFKYRGRIHIPDESKRGGTTGTIVAVGYNCDSQFFDKKTQGFRSLRIGDKVAYGTWTGTAFRFDQRPSYRILMDNEIASLLDPDHTKLQEVEA